MLKTIAAVAALGVAAPASAAAIFSGDSLLTIRVLDFAIDSDFDGQPDVDADNDGVPDSGSWLGARPNGVRVDATRMTGVLTDTEGGSGAFSASSTPGVTVFSADSADLAVGDRVELAATVGGSASSPPSSNAQATAATEASLDFYYYSDDVDAPYYFAIVEISQSYTIAATADDLVDEMAQAMLNALVTASGADVHAFSDVVQSGGPTANSDSISVLVSLWITPFPAVFEGTPGTEAASLIATNDVSGTASSNVEPIVEAPEPAALGLLGLGLLGAAAARRRR